MGIELILAALAAGAAAASKDVASQALKDAYNGLKALLIDHFGGRPEAELALAQHATKPDVWKLPLQDALTSTGADTDAAILEAARHLQQLAERELNVVSASGQNPRAFGRTGEVAMDNATIVKPNFTGNIDHSAIAIAGRDASGTSVSQSGVADQTLAALFAPILDEIRARPANPAVSNVTVQEKVEAIRDEAAKGSAANAVRIAGWLGELGAFAPDIRSMVADTVRQAGGAVSGAVRHAVEQVMS